MMKRKSQSPSASIGIASLLVVFLILCLVTFAVLSLSSAKSNYQFSEKTANHKADFYEAANRSEEILAYISSTMSDGTISESSTERFCAVLGDKLASKYSNEGLQVLLENGVPTASWTIEISKSQALEVSISLNPGGSPDNLYTITKYHVVSTNEKNYNQNMDLMKQ